LALPSAAQLRQVSTRLSEVTAQREQTAEQLQQSETSFRLLVDGETDYAIYMLDPQGCVTCWNSGAERIKGYTAAEILGQHFSRFYTEQDRAAGIPAHALATARATGRYEVEGWRVRKDGARFWASIVVHPLFDTSGA